MGNGSPIVPAGARGVGADGGAGASTVNVTAGLHALLPTAFPDCTDHVYVAPFVSVGENQEGVMHVPPPEHPSPAAERPAMRMAVPLES